MLWVWILGIACHFDVEAAKWVAATLRAPGFPFKPDKYAYPTPPLELDNTLWV
jgi:hypothetical protein